jgi:histone acetyltransferase (RNA polymerase elongator complex component)
MTFFESYQVRHRGKIILETLDFGEAMKLARETSKASFHRATVLQCIGVRDYYTTRGYWEDGVWYD